MKKYNGRAQRTLAQGHNELLEFKKKEKKLQKENFACATPPPPTPFFGKIWNLRENFIFFFHENHDFETNHHFDYHQFRPRCQR